MHSMLTSLSLIALIGAAVLSFMNKEKLASELEMQTKNEKDIIRTEELLKDSRATLEEVQGNLDTATTELETFAKEAEQLGTQMTAKEEELETVEGTLEAAKEDLSNKKDTIAEIGDLEEVTKQVEGLRAENATLSSKLASLNSEVESATKASDSLQAEIDRITKLTKDIDNGVVPENFSASIAQVFPEWGFVVLGAGYSQRAAEGATLSVRRGGEEVAQLKVTDLLQNRAVADIVRGSIASGITLQAGDRVFPAAAAQ